MSEQIPDPVRAGLARGWRVSQGSKLAANTTVECDVVVVGTGAGGAITAELLTKAKLKVVLIEEGSLKSSDDFRMREAQAYSQMYWERAARKTRDKAITILQGRTVGGSTTVNWTSSARLPAKTLEHWHKSHGLRELSAEKLAPWFAQVERRLNINPWELAPNENNDLLTRGARVLKIATTATQRNVRNCWDLGFCGLGCPTNAKQSMLVTTLPVALRNRARLYTQIRADRLILGKDKIERLECSALGADGTTPTGKRLVVRARHYVLAGGAINTPALLLRSRMPDPHKLIGARTFLHPTVMSRAVMPQRVEAWQGAPQSVHTDHFLEQPFDGPMGYKIEALPLHPMMFATSLQGFGVEHVNAMREFPNTQALIASLRDGFHRDSPGGKVQLRADGSAILDYPFTPYLQEGMRRALLSMAELQLAAGARFVSPVHEQAGKYSTWNDAKAAIARLSMEPLLTRVMSMHVMGGCPFGSDERTSVVDLRGRHRQFSNLSIHDASLFPTSIGASPQTSIYAITAKLASQLAADLSKRRAPKLA